MIGVLFWLSVLLAVYVYVGYPLAVVLLSRLRPPTRYPGFGEADWPAVTLIVAAYREEQAIGAKLENTLALDYPADRLEVIVALDGNEDRTADAVQRFANRGVILDHKLERGGKAAALNRAAARASGEILVFSDANNLYDTHTLHELVRPFSDAQVGGVSGAKHVVAEGDDLSHSEGLYWRYESAIKRAETRLGSTVAANGEILAIRKALFGPLPTDSILDDFVTAMLVLRRGYRMVFAADAHSYERASATVADERVRRARIVSGRFQAAGWSGWLLPWQRPGLVLAVVSHKYLRLLLPLGMLVAAVMAAVAVVWPPAPGPWALARLAPPWGLAALALQVLFYGMAVAGAWLERQGRHVKLLYLPAFLVSSNWAMLDGMLRFLRGGHTVKWRRVTRRNLETE